MCTFATPLTRPCATSSLVLNTSVKNKHFPSTLAHSRVFYSLYLWIWIQYGVFYDKTNLSLEAVTSRATSLWLENNMSTLGEQTQQTVNWMFSSEIKVSCCLIHVLITLINGWRWICLQYLNAWVTNIHVMHWDTMPTVPYCTITYRNILYCTTPYRTIPDHTLPYHHITPYHKIWYKIQCDTNHFSN